MTVEFETPTTEMLLKSIPGVAKVVKINELSWKLEAKSGEDIRPRINKFAVENNLALLSLHREEHNLEDVFRELTGKMK